MRLQVAVMAQVAGLIGVVVQAVPLPEAQEVKQDPGPLPEPSRVTQAYFEVSTQLD